MRRIARADLEAKMRRPLEARGLTSEHVDWIVAGLVETSLRGVDSHGVRLLGAYLRELDRGRARPKPDIVVDVHGATARVDAGGALGIVAGRAATRVAVDLARTYGTGVVTVANSNHFGAGAIYALEMARAGLVGLALTNSDALVVPHGGRRPLLGTNPIAAAAPTTDDAPLCLDLATSQGSFLRSLHARTSGLETPPGVLVDGDGIDASASGRDGVALLPLGGYKGQGLGTLVTVFTALLAGGPFDHELVNMYQGDWDEPRAIAHFFLAIDPSVYQPLAAFAGRVAELQRHTRAVPASGEERVSASGDREHRSRIEREREGIPIDEETWELLHTSPPGPDAQD